MVLHLFVQIPQVRQVRISCHLRKGKFQKAFFHSFGENRNENRNEVGKKFAFVEMLLVCGFSDLMKGRNGLNKGHSFLFQKGHEKKRGRNVGGRS